MTGGGGDVYPVREECDRGVAKGRPKLEHDLDNLVVVSSLRGEEERNRGMTGFSPMAEYAVDGSCSPDGGKSCA